MAKKDVATAKSLMGLVNDLSNTQLLALTDSANRRALKKFLNGLRAIVAFIVADHFKKDNPEIRFCGFGDNFCKWFMGLVEGAADVAVPKFHHDLTKGSLDEEILNDLGGADKATVTMAGVYELLKSQPNGEKEGALLVNGYANIFYVKDADGVLRAVYVYWDDGGWLVNAHSVVASNGWAAGCRVFSRNS